MFRFLKRICSALLKQKPVSIVLRQKVEVIAHQGDAVAVAILHELERAVAFPHAALGAEGLHDAADQGGQVEIRRRFLAQCVEGTDLHRHLGMLGQGAQGVDVGVADRSVGTGADAAQVVDDHGCVGKLAAHAVDFGEAVDVDQARERLAGLGGGGEHRVVSGRREPALRRLLAVARLNSKRRDAERCQVAHGSARIGGQRVDDRSAHKTIGVQLDHVEHVAVVEAVIAHLDQVHPADARGPALGQQLLGRERFGLHVGDREVRRQRVVGDVRRPDVRVGVDIGFEWGHWMLP